jgi:Asp-tRNA(Asn)/Glu-tRNA(Gln) amidotransferase A subunit family amidase
MQVAAPRHADADVLAAAAAVERRRPWRDRYPE